MGILAASDREHAPRRILAALEAKMSDFFHEVLEQPSFVYYREFEVGRTDDSKFRRITASERDGNKNVYKPRYGRVMLSLSVGIRSSSLAR